MNRFLLAGLAWAASSITLLTADDIPATNAPAMNAPAANAPATNAPPVAPQDEVDAEVEKARTLVKAKKAMDALPIALALMKGHRKDARAWCCLGEVDVAINLISDATNAEVKATQLDPTNYKAWCILGNCYYQVDDLDNAIAAATKAIDLQPDSMEGWRAMGSYYGRFGREPSAFRAKMQELVGAHPNSAPGWALIAQVDIDLQATQEARGALDKAVRLNSTDGDLWSHIIGPAYAKIGDLDDSLAALKQGVKLAPNDAVSWNNLGFTYANMSKYDEAIDAYNKAVTVDPTYFRSYYNLTTAYQKEQKWDLARDNWLKLAKYSEDQAAELTPNFPADEAPTLAPAPAPTPIVIPAQ
jgi:tetratricopeptide (TPR) repeat protein